MYKIIIVLLLFYTAACSFDNDTKYVPYLHSTFVLAQDSNQNNIIFLLKDSSLVPLQLTNLAQPSDFYLYKNVLFITDPLNKQIIKQNISKNSIVYWSLDIIPNLIAVGDKYLAIIDTVNQKILYKENKDKKSKEYIVDISFKPSQIAYNNGRFYIFDTQNYLHFINETALTEESVALDIQYPVTDIFFDEYFRLNFITTESDSTVSNYISTISADANVAVLLNAPTQIKQKRVSPIWRNQTDHEFRSYIELYTNGLTSYYLLKEDSIQNVALEPQFSTLIYTQRDSLTVFDLFNNNQNLQFHFPYKTKKIACFVENAYNK